MRQLGRHQFQQEPVWQIPGQAEGQARVAARMVERPQPGRHRQQAEWPHEQRIGQRIIARRHAVRFLALGDLADEILADGLLPEGAAAFPGDGGEPGQHDQRQQQKATSSLQPRQPVPVALEGEEGEDGDDGQKRGDRPLDQDADALCCPEQPGQIVGRSFIAAGSDVNLRQRALRDHATGKQHRVGLGDAPLEGGGEDGGDDEAGGKAGIGAEQIGAGPGDRHHRHRDAQRRDQAIDPDRRGGAVAAQRQGRRLQPVDADRFLVAGRILEADVDIVAALGHLLGGLDEARLVAVDHRQAGQARRRKHQAEQEQEEISAGHLHASGPLPLDAIRRRRAGHPVSRPCSSPPCAHWQSAKDCGRR